MTYGLCRTRRAPLAVLITLVAALSACSADRDAQRWGQQLFEAQDPGGDGLRGRLVGHEMWLPSQATRCANCHQRQQVSSAPASAPSAGLVGNSTRFGSVLNRQTLTQLMPRRGGPPSAYDASRLCKLLREGIDPVWVLINTSMPRYEVSDAQCEALWQYLISS